MVTLRFALLAALGAGLVEGQAPRPASEILQAAEAAAGREHKAVFLVFHASW